MIAPGTLSFLCCRPCRCGTTVHTDDGREPVNACSHGDAICIRCAPGDCQKCTDEQGDAA